MGAARKVVTLANLLNLLLLVAINNVGFFIDVDFRAAYFVGGHLSMYLFFKLKKSSSPLLNNFIEGFLIGYLIESVKWWVWFDQAQRDVAEPSHTGEILMIVLPLASYCWGRWKDRIAEWGFYIALSAFVKWSLTSLWALAKELF